MGVGTNNDKIATVEGCNVAGGNIPLGEDNGHCLNYTTNLKLKIISHLVNDKMTDDKLLDIERFMLGEYKNLQFHKPIRDYDPSEYSGENWIDFDD